jgi:hypothetical protein
MRTERVGQHRPCTGTRGLTLDYQPFLGCVGHFRGRAGWVVHRTVLSAQTLKIPLGGDFLSFLLIKVTDRSLAMSMRTAVCIKNFSAAVPVHVPWYLGT